MIFLLGVCLGTFLTVTIIREALPLKQHFPVVVIYTLCITPIFLILFFWYLHIIKVIRHVFGSKEGEAIILIILFLIVTTVLVFSLLSGLFFFAIA